MTCKTTHSLLVDYDGGDLDAARRAQVAAHLGACPACAGLAREMASARALLRGLPARQTSAHFEARLADRLAQARRPAPGLSMEWWRALADGLRRPGPALRPALALGAALVAVVGTLSYHPAAPVTPAALPTVDTTLIAQCVALHQRDVAAQPLSAPAMQDVAAHAGTWNGDTTTGAALGNDL